MAEGGQALAVIEGAIHIAKLGEQKFWATFARYTGGVNAGAVPHREFDGREAPALTALDWAKLVTEQPADDSAEGSGAPEPSAYPQLCLRHFPLERTTS